MSTQTLPKATDLTTGPNLTHAYCLVCYPNRGAVATSLCGASRKTLTGRRDLSKPVCAVCADLLQRTCPVCGVDPRAGL